MHHFNLCGFGGAPRKNFMPRKPGRGENRRVEAAEQNHRLVVLGVALFASHGATVEGYALNDLMTFFGWINALDQRMVPSVDFQIPVEVLAHILPWLNSRISGQFAGAMEWAGVLVAVMLLALACIVLRGRASAAFVVGFGLLLRRFPKAAIAGLAAFLDIA